METSVAKVLPLFWLKGPVAGGGTRSGRPGRARPASAGVGNSWIREDRRRRGRPLRAPPSVTDRAEPPEVWEGDRPTHSTGIGVKTGSEKQEGGLGIDRLLTTYVQSPS